MTFVTTLRLRSGDRAALDGVVAEIRETAERKGAAFRGPHTDPPEEYQVPQYTRADGASEFSPWRYTVYSRTVKIEGHDDLARRLAQRSFPESIHVEVEVERVTPAGAA